MGVEATKEIDARGSFCPGPLMEMIRGIREANVGDTVAVLSKDPGSRTDIPAWIEKAKHELVAVEDEAGYTRFVARKAR
ncbi:MAG: sulfurtransferase TusA family protein [Actinobacteria bacterium]|jgi:TusA-related sulfurtransferase|nr:sulfurtransferase TusA family protein [Actinomycetota bacterium]MCL6095905.1 sulfurtransferase TusA family protein [Actinomycetota bacterium]